MLSFIVLGDGPCTAKSFRPHEDETQWWARRDALVRIIAAACYLGSHVANPVTRDLTLFFHNGQQNEHTTSADGERLITAVAVLRPLALSQEVAIPNECNLLRVLRTAFSKAEKTPSSLFQQLADENNKSSTASVLCSTTLWKEKLFQEQVGTGGSSSGSGQNKGKSLKHLQISGMDKKELLAHLQACCPLDFLRQHRLNGHEKLILKKVNKAQLESVWTAWNDEFDKLSTGLKNNIPTENGNVPKESDDFQYLLQSFLVLLALKKQQTQTNSAVGNKRKLDNTNNNLTILLLHEDYPHELPVYGAVNDMNDEEETKQHDVICILGGVRDATDAEITALLTAADRLNIPVVGANLGRTAEFTSKIISTLCGHAIAGRAIPAIRKMPYITLQSGAILKKLPSLRSNTWDGYAAKSRVVDAPTNVQSDSIKQDMMVIVKLPFQREMLTTAIDQRDKIHPLIQLFVTTMWKSRMASEDANGETQGLGVDSTLILVFEGDVVVRFERKDVAEKIAASHMAAPSEFQVLTMMIELIQNSSNIISTKKLQKYESTNILEQVLFNSLPSKLDKEERKTFLKQSLVFFPSNIRPLSKGAKNVQPPTQGALSSIADKIYAEMCGCGSTLQSSAKSYTYFVMFDLTRPLGQPTDLRLSEVLYTWRYKDRDYEESKLNKLQQRIVTSAILNLQQCPPSLGIVMLQQWTYHLRLHML